MCILTDGAKLTLSSCHIVLTQCTFVIRVHLCQILLDSPQLPLSMCKAARFSKLTVFLLTQDSLVLRAGYNLSLSAPCPCVSCPQFPLSMCKHALGPIMTYPLRPLTTQDSLVLTVPSRLGSWFVRPGI